MVWWWMEAQVGSGGGQSRHNGSQNFHTGLDVGPGVDQLDGKTIRAVSHPVLTATPRTMGCGLVKIFNRRAGMIGSS